ncbi:dihydrofolate reductase [Paenalkalicoccus suaedae]|uniref:Dihydrofolate reductase n=1 Tax=Paenalkalicoccus suaedae TaxID=2592382 RepID=A0A859FH92_9BACI|nr:dihydrofolate reductase [Paenalkalicoccus suaedae]QKS72198.1 dihydrofolate reductase [Paenalkalicoccus suaedae]
MLAMIVAHDRNRVIGRDNAMPWHLPADLAFFKRTTTGSTIVMGRKTFESIGRPLPNRRSIILTRNEGYSQEGAEVVHSFEELTTLLSQDEKAFIIGGAEIFRYYLDKVDRVYVTYIDSEFEGDTYFPELDPTKWVLKEEQKGVKDEKNPYDFYFRTYDAVEPLS